MQDSLLFLLVPHRLERLVQVLAIQTNDPDTDRAHAILDVENNVAGGGVHFHPDRAVLRVHISILTGPHPSNLLFLGTVPVHLAEPNATTPYLLQEVDRVPI